MPRYCEHCTLAGFVTDGCWKSNPDSLAYAVVRDGAFLHTHTGPHAEQKALEQAHNLAHQSTRKITIETYFYDSAGRWYNHVDRDRRILPTGEVIEEGPDYTGKKAINLIKSRHRRRIHRIVSPHGMCEKAGRCVEHEIDSTVEACR